MERRLCEGADTWKDFECGVAPSGPKCESLISSVDKDQLLAFSGCKLWKWGWDHATVPSLLVDQKSICSLGLNGRLNKTLPINKLFHWQQWMPILWAIIDVSWRLTTPSTQSIMNRPEVSKIPIFFRPNSGRRLKESKGQLLLTDADASFICYHKHNSGCLLFKCYLTYPTQTGIFLSEAKRRWKQWPPLVYQKVISWQFIW